MQNPGFFFFFVKAIQEVLNFYSILFLVPKPGGIWRPILNLNLLNAFIPHFSMESTRSVCVVEDVRDFDASFSDMCPQLCLQVESYAFLAVLSGRGIYQHFGCSACPFPDCDLHPSVDIP